MDGTSLRRNMWDCLCGGEAAKGAGVGGRRGVVVLLATGQLVGCLRIRTSEQTPCGWTYSSTVRMHREDRFLNKSFT